MGGGPRSDPARRRNSRSAWRRVHGGSRQSRVNRWSRRALVVVPLGLVLVALMAVAVVYLYRAASAGRTGERALLSAIAEFDAASGHQSITSADFSRIARDVDRASSSFASMRRDLNDAGPMLAVGRYTPFIRIQIRGADVMADAGQELSAAAGTMVTTADQFENPVNRAASISDSLQELNRLQSALAAALGTLLQATNQVATLNGKRLLGPLGSAHAALVARLPRMIDRASAAEGGLRAFIVFAGGTGPRRYLFLSQNPDEVRPTGGYIGTYGVLTATAGHIQLGSYGDMNTWYLTHPKAQVPIAQAPTASQILLATQTIANSNESPDWPTDAQLAVQLWAKGGEPSVDGVLSFTPEFMARLLGVLGPVAVPSYGETVTSANLIQRVDYWTHLANVPQVGGRKQFVSDLAKAVMDKLSSASSGELQPLARAAAKGFATGEAMAWSSDPAVDVTLAHDAWDHAFPPAQATGDFFFDSEFEFAAKNGDGLIRTFTHTVTLRADGSGDSATTMLMHNTRPTDPGGAYNEPTFNYIVDYGPGGATLAKGSDVPYYASEPNLGGHALDDWFGEIDPLGTETTHVVFHVPHLLTHVSGHLWEYSLDWLRLPSHAGDTLQLQVILPPGWHWEGAPPPSTIPLDRDVHESWQLLTP